MGEPRYILLLVMLLSLLTGGISQAMMLTAVSPNPSAKVGHLAHTAIPTGQP